MRPAKCQEEAGGREIEAEGAFLQRPFAFQKTS